VISFFQRFLQWFRHEAEEQRAKDTELYIALMNQVQIQIKAGIAQPSVALRGLERQEEFGLTDLELAFALSAPFSARVGTVISSSIWYKCLDNLTLDD